MNEPNDLVTHPEVPNDRNPAEPDGLPDPPPVTDPPLDPDTETVPIENPVPPFPEPIPDGPSDVVF
jgi:hypothetical protein